MAAALGAGVGAGTLIMVAGLAGRPLFPPPVRRALPTGALSVQSVVAVGTGLVVGALTGWLVGAVLAAVGAVSLPRLLGGKAAREAAISRTEAIASWTEMIRDSIAAASGLEEAITATLPVAPAPIRREVALLVGRMRHASLPDALAAFGEKVDHPSADLVVAALTIAARLEARDLSGLLSRLADSIRGEARMRIRVEVGRTKIRTATKIIVGVVTATVVLLAALNREYLAVYDDAVGQLVLAIVSAIFAAGGFLLVRMAGFDLPDRFTARRAGGGTAS